MDMTGLLTAQKVSRPTDIEIPAGQGKPRPERIERTKHPQPALGVWRQPPAGAGGQIRVSPRL